MTAASPTLSSVATYRRVVNASTERVWENVHDWEHLPWLHGESFFAIEPLDSGDWGWRARIGIQPEAASQWIELELVIEPDEPRYVSRTLSGPGAGSEIWTTVAGLDAGRTAIEVEFRLPDVAPESAPALGAAYTRLYTRLWDEDEAMMSRRAELLERPKPERSRESLALGHVDELRARLPLVVEHAGRRWRIVLDRGELLAHATVCPHFLGPLGDAPVEDGCVRCPWHGYRFDLRSGRNPDEPRMRLPSPPRIRVDPITRRVTLHL